jgi:hypothetical protein
MGSPPLELRGREPCEVTKLIKLEFHATHSEQLHTFRRCPLALLAPSAAGFVHPRAAIKYTSEVVVAFTDWRGG